MKKSVFRQTHEELKAQVEEMLEITPPKVEVDKEHVKEEKTEAKKRGRKRII